MTKTVDELMRLADEYAIHPLDTAKGADNVLETGVARLALRSALEEVVSRWRPTGPEAKSGDYVLVGAPGLKSWVARWVVRPRAGARWECVGGALFWQPTHWQPLPELPEDSMVLHDAAMQQAPEQDGDE